MKSITVITPTYNRAHTLERVYTSLKNQTIRDFKWLIMDDGSTDETSDLVKYFINEGILDIDYFYHSNQHKFITVFKGVEKVETPFFMVVDSDDSYPQDAIEILLNEASKLENKELFISVMGLSIDENNVIVGDKYPGDGFDGSIFDMRYKYKVKGDKFGIFITETYQGLLRNFDYTPYIDKGYIPQSVFFNTYDSQGIRTRFVNKNVRIYHLDVDDQNSVSNTRWFGKNTFGLMEGHRSFLNSYQMQLLKYPKALVRNIVGYQLYAILNGKGVLNTIRGVDASFIKIIFILLYPMTKLYKLKIERKK